MKTVALFWSSFGFNRLSIASRPILSDLSANAQLSYGTASYTGRVPSREKLYISSPATIT